MADVESIGDIGVGKIGGGRIDLELEIKRWGFLEKFTQAVSHVNISAAK
ncbi:hypothetical protein COLO4_06443 [Corchorus olitorius]|uniref:Uncharacterized protein n=1 Tax=Corchorus olitorius TaxID=93759 RepID=A0A1R3KN32_9ROSI|nr:hypothetical protein COLO4_06443 [Corchorus olitorius]